MEKADSTNPLDQVLMSLKSELCKNFTQKWSNHKHLNHDSCNGAIVIDGLWKVHRMKCAFENTFVKTKEFGSIQTGCVRTPNYGSYYCTQHQGNELTINCDGDPMKVKPQNIKVYKLSKLNSNLCRQ